MKGKHETTRSVLRGFKRDNTVAAAFAGIRKQPVGKKCLTCGGNETDAPCAYPSEGKPGCLQGIRPTITTQLPYRMYARSEVDLLITQALENDRRTKFRLVGWIDLDGEFLRQLECPTQPGTWTALYTDRSLA